MNISIKLSHIRAAMTHAARMDIRNYLNGVLIEVNTQNELLIVATDGHRAFIGNAGKLDEINEPMQVIVPLDILKIITKLKVDTVLLTKNESGAWAIGGMEFKPVDGTFPDFRRIVPAQHNENAAHNFNWKYLTEAQNALATWCGAKKFYTRLISNSHSAVMTCDSSEAFVVVMPINDNKNDALTNWYAPAI